MKHCPVCNTPVEDLYTGLCPNPDCTWEFEFIGTEPTPEIQKRYIEKLKRAKATYIRIKGDEKQKEAKIKPFNSQINTENESIIALNNILEKLERMNNDVVDLSSDLVDFSNKVDDLNKRVDGFCKKRKNKQ